MIVQPRKLYYTLSKNTENYSIRKIDEIKVMVEKSREMGLFYFMIISVLLEVIFFYIFDVMNSDNKIFLIFLFSFSSILIGYLLIEFSNNYLIDRKFINLTYKSIFDDKDVNSYQVRNKNMKEFYIFRWIQSNMPNDDIDLSSFSDPKIQFQLKLFELDESDFQTLVEYKRNYFMVRISILPLFFLLGIVGLSIRFGIFGTFLSSVFMLMILSIFLIYYIKFNEIFVSRNLFSYLLYFIMELKKPSSIIPISKLNKMNLFQMMEVLNDTLN